MSDHDWREFTGATGLNAGATFDEIREQIAALRMVAEALVELHDTRIADIRPPTPLPEIVAEARRLVRP